MTRVYDRVMVRIGFTPRDVLRSKMRLFFYLGISATLFLNLFLFSIVLS